MQPLAGLGGAEFGGAVVPLARGGRVGLEANDFELGQLVGIVARCSAMAPCDSPRSAARSKNLRAASTSPRSSNSRPLL